MKNFVRDSAIMLKFRFQDESGETANPNAANVSISYVPLGDWCHPTVVTYPLAQVGDDWVYEWDSSVAQPCVIDAHAETSPDPVCAVDIQFRLTANRANRELVGDW